MPENNEKNALQIEREKIVKEISKGSYKVSSKELSSFAMPLSDSFKIVSNGLSKIALRSGIVKKES